MCIRDSLFFSACKDDKNESQPTDFILRVNESVSIKLPNSTSYTITTNNFGKITYHKVSGPDSFDYHCITIFRTYLCRDSVSYTHLDVYKRQPINTASGAGSPPSSVSRKSPMTVVMPGVPNLRLLRAINSLPSCLLYTSRCV